VIDCGGVTSGTTSYDNTQAALELARIASREGEVYTRQVRAVRGRGTFSS